MRMKHVGGRVGGSTLLCLGSLGLAALGLGACSATHGVEVYNDTGQVVRAELLTVNARGESNTYSKAIVNRNAMFENRMYETVSGQLMRARFTLADQTVDDGNWVMLNLPETSTRSYNLRLDGGRLRAEESKGRPLRE